MSSTVTVQTKPDATETERARDTAQAIKALLLTLSDEAKILTLTMVFAGLAPELQKRLLGVLGLVSELKAFQLRQA